MSFSFNFALSDAPKDGPTAGSDGLYHSYGVSDGEEKFKAERPFSFVPYCLVTQPTEAMQDEKEFFSVKIDSFEFYYIVNATVSSEPEGIDLVEGVYGGGKKVWECSLDLAQYLVANHRELLPNLSSAVLELGCGHGIPGIALLALNYSVSFSDLNADVLEKVTWSNITKNCPGKAHLVSCMAGDWRNLSAELRSRAFDLIVSAETLYSPLTCEIVAEFLSRHLSPSGVALLATKRFYFGVNGGTYELQRVVEQKYSALLIVETMREYVDGYSNVRDLLKVSRKT